MKKHKCFFFIASEVVYLKGLWECIPKLILSVCLYHDFQEFIIRIIDRKPKNIQRITRLGLCTGGGGGICADQHAV